MVLIDFSSRVFSASYSLLCRFLSTSFSFSRCRMKRRSHSSSSLTCSASIFSLRILAVWYFLFLISWSNLKLQLSSSDEYLTGGIGCRAISSSSRRRSASCCSRRSFSIFLDSSVRSVMMLSQRSLNSLICSSLSCLSSSNWLAHGALVLVDDDEVLEEDLLFAQVVDLLVDPLGGVDVAVGTDDGLLVLELVAG